MASTREQVEQMKIAALRAVIGGLPARKPGDTLSPSQLEQAVSTHVEALWGAVGVLADAIDAL